MAILHLDQQGNHLKQIEFSPSNADYAYSFNSKAVVVNDILYLVATAEKLQTGPLNLSLIKYNLTTGHHEDYIYDTQDSNDYCLDYTLTDSSILVPGFSLINDKSFGYIKEINFNGQLIRSKYFSNQAFVSGYLWSTQNRISVRYPSGIKEVRFDAHQLVRMDSVIFNPNMRVWGGSFTATDKSTHYVSGDFSGTLGLTKHCSVMKIKNDSINTFNYLFGNPRIQNRIQGIQPVAETESDELYMIGSTAAHVRLIFHPDPTEIALFKTNQNGDTLFLKFYKGEVKYIANSVIATPDGGALIASQKYDWHSPYPNQWDIHLLKVDSLGNYMPMSTAKIARDKRELILFPNPAENQIRFRGIVEFPVKNPIV